jgi:hypothetical protein
MRVGMEAVHKSERRAARARSKNSQPLSLRNLGARLQPGLLQRGHCNLRVDLDLRYGSVAGMLLAAVLAIR